MLVCPKYVVMLRACRTCRSVEIGHTSCAPGMRPACGVVGAVMLTFLYQVCCLKKVITAPKG